MRIVPPFRKGETFVKVDLWTLARKLAPDLMEEIARRAMILEKIADLQPVGRRQLAQRLNLPEREIRTVTALLRDLGYLELDGAGMCLSQKAEEVLESARELSRTVNALTETERRLTALLPVDQVLIAPGNRDEDDQVLFAVGRLCAARLPLILHSGNTLAVTGGHTIAAVARSLQSAAPLNVMVVPARGGMGMSVELQANTLAEEIAGRLGGHYRLLHLPDHLDAAAMQELLRLPDISEAMDLLQRADVILHGIGVAQETMRAGNLPRSLQTRLTRAEVCGESIGAYYSLTGKCLLEASGVGVDLAKLKPTCRMIAVAAGASRAEAIIAVLRHTPHHLLVTDQGAADRMIQLLES